MTDVSHMTHADLDAVREEVAERLRKHDAEHRERVVALQVTADKLDKRVSAVASSEKARLDTLRLECLKLVAQGVSDPTISARELFDFVTDAPKVMPVFVVRLACAVAGVEPKNTHLSISGSWVHWSSQMFAYRFRTADEARAAIGKHTRTLFGDGVMALEGVSFQVVQLPDYCDLF